MKKFLLSLIVFSLFFSCHSNEKIEVKINIDNKVKSDSILIKSTSDKVILNNPKAENIVEISYKDTVSNRRENVLRLEVYNNSEIRTFQFGYYSNNIAPFESATVVIESDSIYQLSQKSSIFPR